MPKVTKILTDADLSAARARPVMDLTPYLEIVDAIGKQGGVGAEVNLAPGESQRTEKRRLSLAAKQRGLKLTWRKSGAGELKFVLASEGEQAPGGRRRRKAS
jgi:hypothetical protein